MISILYVGSKSITEESPLNLVCNIRSKEVVLHGYSMSCRFKYCYLQTSFLNGIPLYNDIMEHPV